jgi:hypothetical protein
MSDDEKKKPYNGEPPFVTGSDTSEDASESMKASAESLRMKVLGHIASAESTCDEVEAALGLRHQTASARIRELALMNKIENSGKRRKTQSGRLATVWRAAPSTPPEAAT